jgi:predicted RNase H-like HicB family nuclease
MATNETEVNETARKFAELLKTVEGGFEVLISRDGKPLAQLGVHPMDRLLDMLRREEDPWYVVVIEKDENGYTAFVPDLPDCTAVAESEEEVEDLIRQVISAHLEALRAEGIEAPEPNAHAAYVQARRKAAA